MEQKLGHGADVVYSKAMLEYVGNYIPEELKAEVKERIGMKAIQKALDNKDLYSISYPVNFESKQLYKKWDFAYLDDTRNVIVFMRADITDLIEEQTRQKENLRNALLQAEQASHAKTDFLSHMSHEIRTPMNAIIGMSTLAAQYVNDPEQVAECISKVGISARFLLSLINDILDMSRIESGKITLKDEKFPFDEFIGNINTIIYNQAKDKGIDYDCIITSFTSPNYIGDATKLQQILINLLGNAVKFTPAGGKTQFIVHQNKVENGKAYMTFTVNDTGIGISEEFQKKMFDPFEQADQGTTAVYQGTGLGLAICKNLVDMMGGTINVNSIEGVGTEFSVNIALGVSDDERSYSMPENIILEKLKALVEDDDVLICENTQSILKEMGIRAEWVTNGKQAVELVRDKHAAKNDFDIVLLDWKMPDMDGIETARRLRTIVGPEVTIIVITAYDWSAIEQEAKAAGVNLLITKPLFKSALLSAFQRIYVEKAQKEEAIKKADYDFSGRHILLVEDHILNVEVAKRLLESRNATVDVAENGLRAIEMFATSPEHYYDVILMDVRMPVMDGLTSARSIRQLRNTGAATIPIVAMSANAFDEDVEKSKAAGMNAHLAKPIEPQLMYATLERLFQQQE
ncbi:MAG: response regulator, partial [Lachnospiraceae bacterium]|nr:response regulator [Lachnospiraceae bacterium]